MGIVSFVSSINSYVILFFIAFVFFLLIGFYIFLKDSKSKQNILFFIWAISFSIGCLGYMFMFWTPVESDVYFFANIAAIGYCTIWPIAINFLILFLKEKLNKLWMFIIFILYSIGIFYVYAALSGLSASAGYERTIYGWVDKPNNTILYPIYLVYVAVCVALVIYLLIKIKIVFNNSENYNKKKQASIMLNSAIPSIMLGIFFNIIAPSNKLNLPSIGFIFSGIWILSVAYSISQYELLGDVSSNIGKKLFEKSKSINISTDPNLLITKVNKSFYDILGYDKNFIGLMDINNIFLFQEDAISSNEIKKLEDIERDVKIKKKDKTIVYANMQVLFSFNKKNKFIGLVFNFTDITALKNQNEILEQKVQERTREANNARTEAERRLRITKQYTRKSVTDLIESGHDPTVMDPEIKSMSMLFSDIRGFTKITEKLEMMDVYDILNIYYKYINKAIVNSNGEIDKLIGDEVMALFDDSNFAVNAAIDMMKILPELNAMLCGDYKTTINIGIGIDSGDVVKGNIGSDVKMDLTVIGNYVNSASRIEGLTKYYGLPLLISGETKERLKDFHDIRFIDKVLVYGKNKPIEIYEVCDYQDNDFISIKNSLQEHYNTAFKFYREGTFDVAISEYKNILFYLHGHDLMDPVLEFYLNRCKRLNKMKEIGRLNDWNGVYSFLEK